MSVIDDSFRTRYQGIPVAYYHRPSDASTPPAARDHPTTHNHREMEFLYVTAGDAILPIGSETYHVHAGDLLCVSPYRLHGAVAAASPAFSHDCLSFDLSVLDDTDWQTELEAGRWDVTPHLPAYAPGEAVSRALAACRDRKPGWEMCVKGNLLLLFSSLREEGHLFPARPDHASAFARAAADYIAERYAEDISSASAAAALFLDRSYFCRRFRGTFGMTFREYLRSFRVEKAKSLLRDTDLSVSAIAVRCGFRHFGHFGQFFRAHVGTTPSVFRKNPKM